jgi:transcriptional regulator with XRE-family HTH domain
MTDRQITAYHKFRSRQIIDACFTHQIRSTVRQELAKTIGRIIAHWRSVHGMTQEDVANALDIDPMTVSRFERGVTLPSLLSLQKIATVFGIPMARMLDEGPVADSDTVKLFAGLMQDLDPDEQAYFLESLKRYRSLTWRKRQQ